MRRTYVGFEVVATLRADSSVAEALDVANRIRDDHQVRARLYRVIGRLLPRRTLIEDLRPGGAR